MNSPELTDEHNARETGLKMAHHKYGERYNCFECGAKFYDMRREDPICPKCGVDQRRAPKKVTVSRSAPPRSAPIKDYDDDSEDLFGDGVSADVGGEGDDSVETPLDSNLVDDIPDDEEEY